MIDVLIEFFLLASTDVAIDKASKRYRLARILRAFTGLLFVALIIGLIYITIKYS